MQPTIRAEHFSKTFSGRRVLDAVNIDLAPGTIHALVGQNGSGKSTLIKILAGFHAPDAGARLIVRGKEVSLPVAPELPRRLGIGFVHQDLGLARSLTVLENLRVGRYGTGRGWRIRWRPERRAVRETLEGIGVEISPDALVSSLRPIDQARVAILRALEDIRSHNDGVIILDEPTAYLPRDGVDTLFATLREIADGGTSVLFVSHRLDEVRRLADWVSVLRDGRLVLSMSNEETSEEELIRSILGFSLEELYPDAHPGRGEVVFAAARVKTEQLDDFNLEVRRGEVVGLNGLLGMGWEQALPALYGAAPASQGTLVTGGSRYNVAEMTPRKARKIGIAFLSADRLREGGVGGASVTENLTLAVLGRYFRHGRLRQRRERTESRTILSEFDVRPPDPDRRFETLSGGNQQKVLLAKWFTSAPIIFLLNEPTQGVDVGARKRIFAEIAQRAERGTAFILASAEHEDLAHLCDRVLVFRHGRVASALHGASLTPQRILEQCFRPSNDEDRAS